MKVIVEIAELHYSIREIEVPDDATDEQIRAKAASDAGGADEINLEYSHTLDSAKWTIRKPNGDHVG